MISKFSIHNKISKLTRAKKEFLFNNFDNIMKIITASVNEQDIQEVKNRIDQLVATGKTVDDADTELRLRPDFVNNPRLIDALDEYMERYYDGYYDNENTQESSPTIPQINNENTTTNQNNDYTPVTIQTIISQLTNLNSISSDNFHLDENGKKTHVNIGNIFKVPIKEENGILQYAIDPKLLIDTVEVFDLINNQIDLRGVDTGNVQKILIEQYFRNRMETKITNNLVYARKKYWQNKREIRKQIENDEKYINLSDEEKNNIAKKTAIQLSIQTNSDQDIENFNFYNELEAKLLGNFYEWQAMKYMRPDVFDYIINLLQEIIANERKGYKNNISLIDKEINNLKFNNAYELLNRSNKFNEALNNIKTIDPNMDLDKIIDILTNYFTANLIAYFIKNTEYNKLYSEQQQTLHHFRSTDYAKNAKNRSIYCRTCGKFRKGGELPEDLDFTKIPENNMNIWKYWELTSDGELLYRFPQETEENQSNREDVDKPIHPETFDYFEDKTTSPEIKNRLMTGCKIGANGKRMCNPVPNLHFQNDIKTKTELFKPASLILNGVELEITHKGTQATPELKETIYGDEDYVLNHYERIRDYLLSPDILKKNQNYNNENWGHVKRTSATGETISAPINQKIISDVIKDFITNISHLNYSSFSKNTARKVHYKSKMEKMEIVRECSNILRPLITNHLMNTMNIDQETAEFYTEQELWNFMLPDVPTKNLTYEVTHTYPSYPVKTIKKYFKNYEKQLQWALFTKNIEDLGETVDPDFVDLAAKPEWISRENILEIQDTLDAEIREIILRAKTIGLTDEQIKTIAKTGIRDKVTTMQRMYSPETIEHEIFEIALGEKPIVLPYIKDILYEVAEIIKNNDPNNHEKLVEEFVEKIVERETISDANPVKEENLQAKRLPAFVLNEDQISNLIDDLVSEMTSTPINPEFDRIPDETAYIYEAQTGYKYDPDFEMYIYNMFKDIFIKNNYSQILNNISNKNELISETDKIITNISNEIFEQLKGLYKNAEPVSFKYFIKKCISNSVSKHGNRLLKSLSIPKESIKEIIRLNQNERSLKDNLTFLNGFIKNGLIFDDDNNIENLLELVYNSIYKEKVPRKEKILRIKVGLRRDLEKLLMADPSLLSKEDNDKRNFVFKYIVGFIDKKYEDFIPDPNGKYIANKNYYNADGSINKTEPEYVYNINLKTNERFSPNPKMGNVFINKNDDLIKFLVSMYGDDGNTESFINNNGFAGFLFNTFKGDQNDLLYKAYLEDYQAGFTSLDHPDPLINDIKQINPKTSYMRVLPEDSDQRIIHDSLVNDIDFDELQKKYPNKTPQEIEDMIRKHKFDLKRGHPVDWDDMIKILTAPPKIALKLKKLKDDDKRVFFSPRMRRYFAQLMLSYYQNPNNSNIMNIKNLVYLKMNAIRGKLPTYAKTIVAASSSNAEAYPVYSAIFGDTIQKICKNAINSDAYQIMGEERVESIKAQNNNWYKSAKMNTNKYSHVIITSDIDIEIAIQNARKLKHMKAFNKMIPSFICVVPFEQFGSLYEVFNWNLKNKGFIARALTNKEAEIFDYLELL